jgi:predicted nucleic acid-binding Zn ribbon protein
MIAMDAPIPHCLYCGGELSEDALFCPRCLVPITPRKRRWRPDTSALVLGVFLAIGIPCAWVISGSRQQSKLVRAPTMLATVHAAAPPNLPARDEAQELIQSCGLPSRDFSTANNDPRPPIPFRVLDYRSQHLQFAFIPGGGAQIGDPPPYHWALSGILDTTTNQRITSEQAAERMSCMNGSAEAAASSANLASRAANAMPAVPAH